MEFTFSTKGEEKGWPQFQDGDLVVGVIEAYEHKWFSEKAPQKPKIKLTMKLTSGAYAGQSHVIFLNLFKNDGGHWNHRDFNALLEQVFTPEELMSWANDKTPTKPFQMSPAYDKMPWQKMIGLGVQCTASANGDYINYKWWKKADIAATHSAATASSQVPF